MRAFALRMADLLRPFIPPVAFTLWRRLHSKPQFTGIFERFDQVSDEQPWAGSFWRGFSEEKLNWALEHDDQPLDVPYVLITEVTNDLARAGQCRVLDLGGGTGFSYFLVRPGLQHLERVRWVVVDQPSVTRIGAAFADEAITSARDSPSSSMCSSSTRRSSTSTTTAHS